MKYLHPDMLDGGLLAIKAAAVKLLLISNYTAGDSYATVIAAKLAEVTVASTDFTISASGQNRQIVSATKTATLTAGTNATTAHFAFTDGASRVLWVTDETSDQVLVTGNTVNFPTLQVVSNQPT